MFGTSPVQIFRSISLSADVQTYSEADSAGDSLCADLLEDRVIPDALERTAAGDRDRIVESGYYRPDESSWPEYRCEQCLILLQEEPLFLGDFERRG